IRTDADGDTLWTKTYGGTHDDVGYSVQECAGGGFIIAGETRSFGAGEYDVYLIRTDENGDTLWTKTYGGTSRDRGYSVEECASGGFIITGYTYSFGAGNCDVYLIRTDTDGDTLWTGIYGGTDYDWGCSVQECANGGFIIAGQTESFGAGYSAVWLIRISETGVEEQKELRVESLELRVFPNPCMGKALIKYGMPEKADISLELYDITGRLVKTLYSGTQEKGYHTINVGAVRDTPLPRGIYFIKLETNNYKATKKLTIIR
ncbi:T9SS type A sorting domain-containing protein, partial [candidate division WOR-3 bacterium]|nr:T9SS type A sorting domain-containing protein [candidate division WOR-3 bacterium]